MPCIHRVEELDFKLAEVASLPPFDGALMTDPAEFVVAYAINPHMRDEDGKLQRVDRGLARAQWEELRDTIEACGVAVTVEDPLAGHPDFVFCANPGLPVPAAVAGAPPRWVPSRMASPQRAGEVERLARHFEERGWRVEPLEGPAARFEGTGDGLWHPRRRLLWGGVGPRTERAAWEELAERYDLPIVVLELVDPALYHLDTALAPIDEATCLWNPNAFGPAARGLVEALFADPIEVTDEEARRCFACNAWAADSGGGRPTVVMQEGATRVAGLLRGRGYPLRELQTSEFLKSGGSVFCMKLAHPRGG